jgi:hypothetical protein
MHNVLYLRVVQVSLLQVPPHGEFILGRPPPELPSRQVHAGQHQHSVQPRHDVDLPSLLLNLHDPPDHNVSDLTVVTGLDGGDGDEFVGAFHNAGNTGEENLLVHLGAVAAHVAQVTGDDVARGDQVTRLRIVIQTPDLLLDRKRYIDWHFLNCNLKKSRLKDNTK